MHRTCRRESQLPACLASLQACNRKRYLVGEEEQALVPDTCISGISVESAATAATPARGALAAAALGALALLLAL